MRGVIVTVLFVAAYLGWVANRARTQREAVAAIRKAGGTVAYEWEERKGEVIKGGKPPLPRWIVNVLGLDYLGSVTGVVLYRVGSDEILVHVGRLWNLESLYLSGSPVTDAGLAHLKGLTRLNDLLLADTRVTDKGMASLTGMVNLRRLWLTGTQVTDSGMIKLGAVRTLQWLFLSGTRVTDSGMHHLKGLSALEMVYVPSGRVTNKGATELRDALPNVEIVFMD